MYPETVIHLSTGPIRLIDRTAWRPGGYSELQLLMVIVRSGFKGASGHATVFRHKSAKYSCVLLFEGK